MFAMCRRRHRPVRSPLRRHRETEFSAWNCLQRRAPRESLRTDRIPGVFVRKARVPGHKDLVHLCILRASRTSNGVVAEPGSCLPGGQVEWPPEVGNGAKYDGPELPKFYLKMTPQSRHLRRSEGLFLLLNWDISLCECGPFRASHPPLFHGHEDPGSHRIRPLLRTCDGSRT